MLFDIFPLFIIGVDVLGSTEKDVGTEEAAGVAHVLSPLKKVVELGVPVALKEYAKVPVAIIGLGLATPLINVELVAFTLVTPEDEGKVTVFTFTAVGCPVASCVTLSIQVKVAPAAGDEDEVVSVLVVDK